MDTASPADVPTAQMRRTVRRAALLTSGAGIAFGLLFVVAAWLIAEGRTGYFEAADPEAYRDSDALSGAEFAGLYLLPFAAIAFLWFIVALRGWSRGTATRRNRLVSDLQLVAGVTFVAVFLVGGGAHATSFVVAQTDGEFTDASLQTLSAFGRTILTVMGVRIAAIFVIATASLGMTSKVLPRWFSLLSYLFGVVLILTPVVADVLFLAFPVWMIALSVMLLWHLARLDPDDIPGFTERYALDSSPAAEGTREDTT